MLGNQLAFPLSFDDKTLIFLDDVHFYSILFRTPRQLGNDSAMYQFTNVLDAWQSIETAMRKS